MLKEENIKFVQEFGSEIPGEIVFGYEKKKKRLREVEVNRIDDS